MNLGLTFDKLLLIGIVAVFLLGPERLPHYAAQLGRLVRGVRDMASGAKERMREEMGPDFDEVDWKKLDPRQYDPRRIIREALIDDEPVPAPRRANRTMVELTADAQGAGGGAVAAGAAGVAAQAATGSSEPGSVPFDAEAT